MNVDSDPTTAAPTPLQDPSGQDNRKTGRGEGQQTTGDEQSKPRINRRLATCAVRQGAINHLANGHAEKQQRDYQLVVIVSPDTELLADLR